MCRAGLVERDLEQPRRVEVRLHDGQRGCGPLVDRKRGGVVALFRQDRDRDTVFDDVLTLDPVCELRVPLSQRFLVCPFFQLVDDVFVIVDANGRDG